MAVHVDVLRNEWTAGVQRRVAKLAVNGSGIEVTANDDAPGWTEKLLQPLREPTTGDWLIPEKAPKEFLDVLVSDLSSGSYLVAIGPHDDDLCPVPKDGVVEMETFVYGVSGPSRGT